MRSNVRLLLVLLVLGTMILSACQPAAAPPAEPAEGEAAEGEYRYHFCIVHNNADHPSITACVEGFEDEAAIYDVKLTFFDPAFDPQKRIKELGLQNATDVRDAFDLITYRAQRYVPEARIWGCLVQEMTPSGMEMLVGMVRDPQFGPLVTLGLGGIYVEVLKDATFRVAPFARREAEAMLTELRAHALLDGVRGAPPADKDAIVDCLLRIGQLVQDFPEIVELDINPLTVFEQGQGAMAIDMRLVLASTTQDES